MDEKNILNLDDPPTYEENAEVKEDTSIYHLTSKDMNKMDSPTSDLLNLESIKDTDIAKCAEEFIDPIVKEAILQQQEAADEYEVNSSQELKRVDPSGDRKSEKSSDDGFEYVKEDDVDNLRCTDVVEEKEPSDSCALSNQQGIQLEETLTDKELVETLTTKSVNMPEMNTPIFDTRFEKEFELDSKELSDEDDKSNNIEENENIAEEIENIVEESKNIVDESENIVEESENIVEESENIVEESENIVEESENFAEESKNIDESENNVEENNEKYFDDSAVINRFNKNDVDTEQPLELFDEEVIAPENNNKLESGVGSAYFEEVQNSLTEKVVETVPSKCSDTKQKEVMDKLKRLVLWKSPVSSGLVFGSILLFELALMCNYSVITVIAYFGFFVLFLNICCKCATYFNLLNQCPFSHSSVDLSMDDVQYIIDRVLVHLECMINEIRSLALAVSVTKNLKAIVLFWLLTYIGSMFNLLSLIFIATILSGSLPIIYYKFEDEINKLVKDIKCTCSEKINRAKVQCRSLLGR